MNHIEQEADKATLIPEILSIENPEQLESVKNLLYSFREKVKAPCRLPCSMNLGLLMVRNENNS